MDLLHFFWACNLAMHLPVCALIAGGAFAPAKYRRDSPCNRECQRVAAAAGYSHLTIALTQGLQHLTVCTELVFSVYLILCLSTALPDVRDVLRAVLFPAGVVVGVGFWTFCLWSPSPKELAAPYPDPSRTPSLGQCELATRQVDHLSARRFLEGRGQGTVGGVCDTCVSRRVSCGTWHTTWYVSGAPNILAAVPPLAVPTLLAHALAAHADAASAVGRGRALRLSHAAAACSVNRGHGGRRVRLWLAHMVRRVLLARPQGASISDSSPRLGQRQLAVLLWRDGRAWWGSHGRRPRLAIPLSSFAMMGRRQRAVARIDASTTSCRRGTLQDSVAEGLKVTASSRCRNWSSGCGSLAP